MSNAVRKTECERARAGDLLSAALRLVAPEPAKRPVRAQGPIAPGLKAIGLGSSAVLAHVGDGAERFIDDTRAVLGPEALVHVFEARSFEAGRLARRATADTRLIVHSCTLGPREDELLFRTERHAVRPLDVIGVAPDVISINRPGGEGEVLAGAKRVLRRWRPTVAIAGLFPDADVDAVVPEGYTAYMLDDGALRRRDDACDHAWLLCEPPPPPFQE